MSVKRIKDPAGLLGDHVRIDLTDPQPGDKEAIESVIRYATPRARVERLRRHPQLDAEASQLLSELDARGGSADHALLASIAEAETKAIYLATAQFAIEKQNRLAANRPSVTDADILKAISTTKTLTDAASKLGITERQLRTRRRRMANRKP